jgi:hypothetical protein
MAEWLKAAVLKTASRVIVTGVRIPLPPPVGSYLSESLTNHWLLLKKDHHEKNNSANWSSGDLDHISVFLKSQSQELL